LQRFARPTLGVLLGLLLGAVVGLFPFQRTVPPQPGDTLKGQTVVKTEAGALQMKQTGRAIEPEQYPTRFFTPTAGHVGGALGLILAGFAVTWGIDYLGRPRQAT
jgi:hypothetical protein